MKHVMYMLQSPLSLMSANSILYIPYIDIKGISIGSSHIISTNNLNRYVYTQNKCISRISVDCKTVSLTYTINWFYTKAFDLMFWPCKVICIIIVLLPMHLNIFCALLHSSYCYHHSIVSPFVIISIEVFMLPYLKYDLY